MGADVYIFVLYASDISFKSIGKIKRAIVYRKWSLGTQFGIGVRNLGVLDREIVQIH